MKIEKLKKIAEPFNVLAENEINFLITCIMPQIEYANLEYIDLNLITLYSLNNVISEKIKKFEKAKMIEECIDEELNGDNKNGQTCI